MSLNKLQQYLSMEEFQETEVDQAVGQVQGIASEADPVVSEDTQAELTEAAVEVPPVDETVTDDAVAEAALDAEDAEEEAEEDSELIDKTVDASDEAEEVEASIEHFMVVLSHGLNTKTFSPQAAATAQYQLDNLKKTFGDGHGVPSLESFGKDDLEQYYTASLESFRGFLKRISDVQNRVYKFIPDLVRKGSLVNGFKKRAEAVHKDADNLLRDLGEVNATGPVTVTAISKALSVEGANLLAGLNNDLKLTAQVANKGLKANEKFLTQVGDVLVEATNEGGVGKTGQIVAKAAQIAPAITAYPEGAFTTGFAGGGKLTKKEADGGADTRSALKALRVTAIPGVTRNKAAKPAEMSLSKGDIIKLVNLAKTYASLANASAENTGVAAFENIDKVRGKVNRTHGNSTAGLLLNPRALTGSTHLAPGAQTTSWSEGKDLDALATALPKFLQNHIAVYRFVNDHALSVAKALVELGWHAFGKLEDAAPAGE